MSLVSLIQDLVDDRSLDALERLTGSRDDEVLEALVEAAGEIMSADSTHFSDDEIVETIREHLISTKPLGVLTDALKRPGPWTKEFALSCLSEMGDLSALTAMIDLLEDPEQRVRDAAGDPFTES